MVSIKHIVICFTVIAVLSLVTQYREGCNTRTVVEPYPEDNTWCCGCSLCVTPWNVGYTLTFPVDFSARSHFYRRRDVAVCLFGARFHALVNVTGGAMKRFVVDPLDADVFAAGMESPRSAEALLHTFRERVVSMLFTKQLTLNATRAITKSLPDYDRMKRWDGNAFSPGVMLFWQWLQRCADLVSMHELARGHPYDWVVFSRADLLWLAHHPPLELLQAKRERIYIPDSDGWGGLWSSVVTCARETCGSYTNMWNSFLEGEVYSKMMKMNVIKSKEEQQPCNHEMWVLGWLSQQGVMASRYSSVVHLPCIPQMCIAGSEFCWLKKAKGRCATPEVRWKYPIRGKLADENAGRMFANGKTNWTAAEIKGFGIPQHLHCLEAKKGIAYKGFS